MVALPKNDVDFSMDANGDISDDVLIPKLARVREQGAIFRSELNQSWWITGRDEIIEAFRDPRLSASRISGASFGSIPEEDWSKRIPVLSESIHDWIVNVDGEKHRRLRLVAAKALNKKFVDSLIPLFQSLSDDLTEKAADLREFDFVKEIAYYLPATVILELLGLSHDHLEKVREWNRAVVNALVAMFAEPHLLEAADRAIAEMYDFLRIEIADRRKNPRNDLLTRLVTMTDDEDQLLSEEEVLGIGHILLTAGHETTVNSLSLGLVALVNNPDQAKIFLNGEVAPLLAMQELSRFIGVSTLQSRLVAEDFELGGERLRKNDMVFLWTLAGNNQPDIFPEPRKLDFTRENLSEVVTFGPGFHHCIGHYIARVEMMTFYKTFLPKFSKIEILDDELKYSPTLAFRGLAELNVRVTPA